MINFLEMTSVAGIMLNGDKFQFCKKEVDFAGFRITKSHGEPLPKYIDAIMEFPCPRNIMDIRSRFGLVNQVAHYSKLREHMEPVPESEEQI